MTEDKDTTRDLLAALLGHYIDKYSPVELNQLLASVPADQAGLIYQLIKKYKPEDLASIIQPEDQPRYKIRTAADALTDRPAAQFVIDDLIVKSTITLLVGDAGTKKTYIALTMAVSVATGKDFLSFKTAAGRALYIDEETNEDYLLDRLAEVLRGAYADEKTPVDIISGAGVNLRDPNDVTMLGALIAAGQYQLVIFDAMSDFMPGADENTAKDITPFFLALRKIANDTGCGVVLLHHTNKMTGQYRGSTDIKSKVDTMLMVESEPESTSIQFKTVKKRRGKPMAFAALACWRDGEFYLTHADTDRSAFLTKGEDFVLRFLAEKGASSKSIILGSVDSCTERQASDAIYSLVKKDLIFRTNPGATGRGNEAIFMVKKAAEDDEN